MKCPKCGYLGFERVERCRNCGYEFSLVSTSPTPELPIRDQPPATSRFEDLPLERPASGAAHGPDELPLFAARTASGDEPLIKRASPPRPPLSVRRATPEIAKLRAEPQRTPALDFAVEVDPSTPSITPARPRAGADRAAPPGAAPDDTAPVAARFVAVAIDLLILAVIDALVVYLTLQICGVSFDEFNIVPKGPLIAFLIVQNVGYLVAFTAGGQTLGKMAAGIRVVSSDAEAVDLGRALVRTVVWFVLAIPAGLGFLTAVLSRDHRGLHDRFAGTRVVR